MYHMSQEMFQREAKFKHQKQQELIALQKRIATGREEQKKQRELDLERLLQVNNKKATRVCFIIPPQSEHEL